MSFESLASDYGGVYKKWVQDEFIKTHLGGRAEYKRGVCYGLSVMYILKNFFNRNLEEDGLKTSVFLKISWDDLAKTRKHLGLRKKPADMVKAKLVYASLPQSVRNSLSEQEYFTAVTQGNPTLEKNKELLKANNLRFGGKTFTQAIADPQYNSFVTTCQDVENARQTNWGECVTWGSILVEDLSNTLLKLVEESGNITHDKMKEIVRKPGYSILGIPEHATAVVNRDGKLKYFDPNEGQAIFKRGSHPAKGTKPNISGDVEVDFANFIAEYLKGQALDILVFR